MKHLLLPTEASTKAISSSSVFLAPWRGRRSKRSRLAKLVVAAIVASTTSLPATERSGLTVIELFTSQGCSSCAPANATALALSEFPNVLVLSFGVTYWNYLGWTDTFAKPEFTKRQVDYETPLGHSSPFTPQIVINGRRDSVGNIRSEVERLIAESHRSDTASIEISEHGIKIGAGSRPDEAVDIWLVRYDSRRIEVPVGRGENRGRTLPHKNVVRSLDRLGGWHGRKVIFMTPSPNSFLRTAVLLQIAHGGPILAAATN